MTGPVIVAAVVAAGLAAIGAAAWVAADRADRKAATALANPTCVCTTCRTTPVGVPGEECAACRWRSTTHHVCPVCQTQRVPTPGAPCGVCVHALYEELDRWGATP